MLIIRNEQMAALRDGVVDNVATHAVARLLENAAEQLHGLSPPEYQRRVRWAVDQARAHGFTEYGGLLVFATCLLEFGPSFERHPAVARMLATHHATPAEDRLDRLLDGMPAYIWNELDMIRNDVDWQHIQPRAPAPAIRV